METYNDLFCILCWNTILHSMLEHHHYVVTDVPSIQLKIAADDLLQIYNDQWFGVNITF